MTFEQALARRGIEYRRKAGGVVQVLLCCPFCTSRGETPDTKFRLGVNTRENWARCFNCDWKAKHGAVEKVLRHLAIVADVQTVDTDQPQQRRTEEGLPDGFMLLSDWFKKDDLPGDPLGYLKTRRIRRSQIRKHYVGITYKGRFAWRVLFPVIWKGDYYGMVGRAITKGQDPKYLNSYGDKALYGLPDETDSAILSEGVFKALRLERALEMASASMLGHVLKEEHVQQLKKTGVRRLYIWPDADRAGTRGAVEAAELAADSGFHVYMPHSALPYADECDDATLFAGFRTFEKFRHGLGLKLRMQAVGVRR